LAINEYPEQLANRRRGQMHEAAIAKKKETGFLVKSAGGLGGTQWKSQTPLGVRKGLWYVLTFLEANNR